MAPRKFHEVASLLEIIQIFNMLITSPSISPYPVTTYTQPNIHTQWQPNHSHCCHGYLPMHFLVSCDNLYLAKHRHTVTTQSFTLLPRLPTYAFPPVTWQPVPSEASTHSDNPIIHTVATVTYLCISSCHVTTCTQRSIDTQWQPNHSHCCHGYLPMHFLLSRDNLYPAKHRHTVTTQSFTLLPRLPTYAFPPVTWQPVPSEASTHCNTSIIYTLLFTASVSVQTWICHWNIQIKLAIEVITVEYAEPFWWLYIQISIHQA